MDDIDIRPGRPEDFGALERLYRASFPQEDLLPLLRDLLTATEGVLSLVARVDDGVAGHVVFTPGTVAGWHGRVALLAPLAVAPDRQRRGIGRALVREGARRLAADGVARVQVLGDPAYYGRCGFTPDDRVAPPYALPEAWSGAWQGLRLGANDPPPGTLSLPRAWQRPELWGA